MSHHQTLPGHAAGTQTNTTYPAPEGADRDGIGDQAAQMDRGVATEEPHSAPLYARRLGYPPLCAHGMNSFTDRDYGLALARLRRG